MANTYDLASTVTFTPFTADLPASVLYIYVFDEGDNVSFMYDGADCHGSIIQQLLDENPDTNYIVNVYSCSDWSKLTDTRVQVPASTLTPLAPQQW